MSVLDKNQQEAAEKANAKGILPGDIYVARVYGCESWKQGDSLVWKFRVAEGDYTGKELWDWTGLTAASIYRTKARFEALGLSLDADEDAIFAVPVQLTIEEGTNKQTGEPKNIITSLIPFEGKLAPEPAAAPDTPFGEEADEDVPF